MTLADLLAQAEVEAERLAAIGDEAAAQVVRNLLRFARAVADACEG